MRFLSFVSCHLSVAVVHLQLCICNAKINQLRNGQSLIIKISFTGKMMYLVTLSVVSRLKIPLAVFPSLATAKFHPAKKYEEVHCCLTT